MIYITKDVNEKLDYVFIRDSDDPITSVSYTQDNVAGLVIESANINALALTDEDGNTYDAGKAVILWVSGGVAGKSEKVILNYTTEAGRILDEAVIFRLIQEY